jgi:hypothetical protein
MSDGANEALLIRAWKSRNNLYQDMFGEHAYVLPKHYTPPAGSLPGFRRASAVADLAGSVGLAGVDATTTDCRVPSVDSLINDDKTHIVKNSDGANPADMQPIRDLVSSFFSSSMSNLRVTVLAYPPSEVRPYWLYVTAGLSNPWYQDEANEVSGFGCELMVKSKTDARWPVRLLRRMAYYILSYTGTLSPGVFLNLQQPIGVSGNARADLNNIFIWYADEAPDCWYQLPSGGFGLFCAIGITEDECRFAESVTDYGAWCIQQVLRQTGVGQITDPRRESVMGRENIGEILSSVRMYAENFRPITP